MGLVAMYLDYGLKLFIDNFPGRGAMHFIAEFDRIHGQQEAIDAGRAWADANG